MQTPDSRGATVSLNVDFDLGILGKMVPNRTVQRFLDNTFGQIVQQIESRGALVEAPVAGHSEAYLRVFKTMKGLEVEIAGERYLLRPTKTRSPQQKPDLSFL